MISSGFVLSIGYGSQGFWTHIHMFLAAFISPFWSCSSSYSKRLLRCWVQSLSSFTYPASPTWHKPWIQKLPLSFWDSIRSLPDSRPYLLPFFTAFRFASLKLLNLWWRKAASLGQMELEKQRSVFPPPPAMLRWFRTDGFRAHCSLEWTQTQTHMGMGQYLLKIPFLVGWTSIYQLFWCSPGVQGFDTLPHQCSSCLLKGARS